ncbi:MAG: 60S ribosomal export protein NMD3, partial [Candidatus Methanomethylicus sp.]|nr:60S ribosomal export protein NMD3 [Candidatus Methanomethylicus sp.]
MGRFCAKCGKDSGQYIRGLCHSCYWEEPANSIPTEFTVTFCRSCQSHLQGKRWVRPRHKKDYGDFVDAAAAELLRRVDLPKEIAAEKFDGTVTTKGDDGLPKAMVLKTTLREKVSGTCSQAESLVDIAYTYCGECDSAARGKYDAVVQIRAEGREVDEADRKAIQDSFESTDRKTAVRGRQEITEIKENEGGLDVKFVSLHVARVFTRDLFNRTGALISEHPQLIGLDKDDGSRAYRNTIAVRIPSLRRGNIIDYKGKILQIVGVDKGMFAAEDLAERYSRINLPRRELELGRIVREDEIRRVRLDAKAPACVTLYDLAEQKFIEIPADSIPNQMEKGEEGIMLVIDGKERVFKPLV